MIVDKLTIVNTIKTEIPDNSTGQISPRDVRHNLLDIIDSVHLFTADHNLLAKNFSTPATRTTRAGDLAIGKLHLQAYSSVDNSAYGYSALAENYDGQRNTAIGSQALSCSLYGQDNTAVGYQAIAGNVFGSGNVALGNLALYSNKLGNFNIAIGHGAGYYVGTNQSYRFYVGSHDVEGSGICEDLSGSGVIPLMYGDLKGLVLGVAVSGLHEYGTLQVGGHITPSENPGKYDLGHEEKRWRDLFISDSIEYPDSSHLSINRNTTSIVDYDTKHTKNTVVFLESGGNIGLGTNAPSGDQGLVTSSGSIVPLLDREFSLGHPELIWSSGYFQNLFVDGQIDVTTYNYQEINSCLYECKTLYLAVAGDPCYEGGPPCGYLTDQELEGAGIVIQSSGLDDSNQGFFRRNYEWVYNAPDPTLVCLDYSNPYSRSSWNSNISIHIASGSHLKTDRVVGYDNVAIVNTNGCYGWFINRDDDIIRTGDLGRNEIQAITLEATDGTFTLSFDGEGPTDPIPYDASAATVQEELEKLDNIAEGDIVVTGNNGGTWTIVFTGNYALTNVPLITCDADELTVGGTVGETRVFFAHRHRSYPAPYPWYDGITTPPGGWTYHIADIFQIRNSSSPATGGSWKIRFRTQFDDVIHETDPIPYDATSSDIVYILNDKVASLGVTGWTATLAGYQIDQSNNEPNIQYDTISEIIAAGGSIVSLNPTQQPLQQPPSRESRFYVAKGWPDRDDQEGISKISFHDTNGGSLRPNLDELSGSFTWTYYDYSRYYNGDYQQYRDFAFWSDSNIYNNDVEPQHKGHYIVFTQSMEVGDDYVVGTDSAPLYTSDTVATAQLRFNEVFGTQSDGVTPKVLISSNGIGLTKQTKGFWPEGSVADDLMEAGWFITYLDATLMEEDQAPVLRYYGPTGYSHVGTKGRTGVHVPSVREGIMPKIQLVLLRHEGQGAALTGGSCNVTSIQDGMADISAITKVDNVVYLTKEAHIKPNPISPEGKIGNVTDVNFIASGVDRDYHVSYSHLNSDVVVGQRLVTRTMDKRTDSANPPRERVTGFSIDYIDADDRVGYTGQREDRLIIAAYDDTVEPLNALTVMRSDDPGLVGISDIENAAHIILPETIFNIQSTGESIIRNTTWGTTHKTSLQLLADQNNPLNITSEGVELEYTAAQRRADISLWDDGANKIVISLDTENKFVGLHKIDPNELLTLGSGLDTAGPVISMEERDDPPIIHDDYGKLYIKPKTSIVNQTQSVYLLDDDGNEFDLTLNKYDMNDGRAVYTDDNGNTFAGRLSNKNRSTILPDQTCNTAYGYKALHEITTGDNNTAIGCKAGWNITTGSKNIIIGESADELVGGVSNIIIGHRSVENTEDDISYNIIIGGDGLGETLGDSSGPLPSKDYNFIIGTDEEKIFLHGIMGPNDSDRVLKIPKGRLQVTQGKDALQLRHKTGFFGGGLGPAGLIEKLDTDSDPPDGGIVFMFTAVDEDYGTSTEYPLLSMRHPTLGFQNSCGSWSEHYERTRPYAELRGDLFVAGQIMFCDGTYFDSTTDLAPVAATGLSSRLSGGQTHFDLNIEELYVATESPLFEEAVPSDEESYLAISTSGYVGKLTIQQLGGYLEPSTPRVLDCHNHIFTSTSTIDLTSNCRNVFAGYRAGHEATGWTDSSFIGSEAGAGATIDYNGAINRAATFIGYRAGYDASNVDNAIFIGSQAGNDADGARYSIFIGDSAGDRSSSDRSIGIGDNALAGTAGTNNIEITAGVGGSNRIMSDGADHNNRLAIGTCIAGISSLTDRRVSIGSPNLNPDAVLQVQAHGSETHLQEWKNSDNGPVAHLTKDGLLSLGAGSSPVAALEVRAFLSATNYLQEWKNNEDTLVARLAKDGSLSLGGGGDPDAVLEVKEVLDADYLQEWKNSGDEVVARLTKGGHLYLKGTVHEEHTF